MAVTKPLAEYLQNYTVDPKTGCHVWRGPKNWFGYAKMSIKKKSFTGSRVAYQYYKGPIPSGLSVLHLCHVPACINPEHLVLGTQKHNMQQCVAAKRRAGTFKRGRLSLASVRKIRTLLISGHSVREIAQNFAVSTDAVYSIKNGHTWKNVG